MREIAAQSGAAQRLNIAPVYGERAVFPRGGSDDAAEGVGLFAAVQIALIIEYVDAENRLSGVLLNDGSDEIMNARGKFLLAHVECIDAHLQHGDVPVAPRGQPVGHCALHARRAGIAHVDEIHIERLGGAEGVAARREQRQRAVRYGRAVDHQPLFRQMLGSGRADCAARAENLVGRDGQQQPHDVRIKRIAVLAVDALEQRHIGGRRDVYARPFGEHDLERLLPGRAHAAVVDRDDARRRRGIGAVYANVYIRARLAGDLKAQLNAGAALIQALSLRAEMLAHGLGRAIHDIAIAVRIFLDF